MPYMKKKIERVQRKIIKEFDLVVSKRYNIDSIESVCLILGPYRNLTTLTASIVFLHPHCQVLNHAGERILGDPRIDFLSNYSDKRFRNFIKYAIHISKGGKRGNYGGSITLSHAFQDRARMGKLLKSNDLELMKDKVKCLFWKESQRVMNHIRCHQVDFDALFSNNDELLFFLPIRNPLDCATSNSSSGFADFLPGVDSVSSVDDVLQAILDEYLWFISKKERYPNRFYYYFAHQDKKDTILEMADFLGLEPTQEWLELSIDTFRVTSKYQHGKEFISKYRNQVNKQFKKFPDFQAGLMKFI